MPSSSALVETTPRMRPCAQSALDLAALARQIAAAIAAHRLRLPGGGGIRLSANR